MVRYYQYRIFPSEDQQKLLCRYFGSARYLYNVGLQHKIKASIKGGKVDHRDLGKLIPVLKKNNPWLCEVPAQVLQMALKNLDNDCTRFSRGESFPLFRYKAGKQSIQFPQGIRVRYKNKIVRIPKLGDVQCVYDRKFTGKIKVVTVSRTVIGKYYMCICTDTQKKPPVKLPRTAEGTVGISYGINTWYGLSNGTRISKPKRITDSERNLRIQQRSLARKAKGSNRRKKQVLVTLKAKEKLDNRTRDYLQKVSTKLVIEHDTIVVETGTDSLKVLLRYKSIWYGRNLIEIGKCPPCPDICSTCGVINKSEGVSWMCSRCNTVHNRNQNNAVNIKNIGVGRYPSGANAPA